MLKREARPELNDAYRSYFESARVATSSGGARIPTNGPGGTVNVRGASFVTRAPLVGESGRFAAARSVEGVPGGHGRTSYPEFQARSRAQLSRSANEYSASRFAVHDIMADNARSAYVTGATRAQLGHSGYGPVMPVDTRVERFVFE